MQEDVDMYIEEAKEAMEHALDHLKKELVKIRAGKASPDMLSGLVVPYYGSPTPLAQVANVSVSDSRTLVIQPWEKSMIQPIEKAIMEANMGFTPQNDGDLIRINIPPLTEDRRKQMVKQVKAVGEDTKVGLRSARRDAMDGIKKAVKDGFAEDAGKRMEDEVEAMTKRYSGKIDDIVAVKEKDILTV
ncbi:ribosome recycling factor [Phaeodactylibacter luteus]|uniref:Ribosome-recycling factor n=1 Tax=Phaeodactylibacter luteus TaxID=1564516 RepID=A0A5C6RXC1_9BACT|nr:ribosome recycling factor [Phaeodactylibacter luteus]TXB66240.1 ribosome recycling factor [Phaeodactylibacter luteus]